MIKKNFAFIFHVELFVGHMNQYKLVFDIHICISTQNRQHLFRFAVVEGADGISAYLDMLDAWYAEHRLFFVDVDVDILIKVNKVICIMFPLQGGS